MPNEAEVEAAARALHKRNGFFPEFERASYAAQQEYREDAKAALEAAERVRWIPLPPECEFVRTRREREEGENICAVRTEWIDRDGRTTVTHHSFAAPTHWQPIPHKSDCATNNAPALPPGPCDCGESK